jgi:hypothetical protein
MKLKHAFFLISIFIAVHCSAQRHSLKSIEYKFDVDSQKVITKQAFDRLVDSCIALLQSRPLPEISDQGHINIIMCLNTFMMSWDSTLQNRFTGGRYEELKALAERKKYLVEITSVYPEYTVNRGMGFYFFKLNMELYGTPHMYAYFNVKE